MTAIPSEARPPEWWTAENTLQWQLETWGCKDAAELSEAQRQWSRPIGHGEPIAHPASLRTAPNAKQYKAWAKGETRPIPVTFYDGTVDHKRQALASGRKP